MTVKELIVKLQERPDQDGEVIVNVKTSTQVYGAAQVTPWDVSGAYGAGACIQVTLPSGMYIANRKVA